MSANIEFSEDYATRVGRERKMNRRTAVAQDRAHADLQLSELQSRELRQHQGRDAAKVNAELARLWGGFLDGISLVMRAAGTVRNGYAYRDGPPFLLTQPEVEDLMIRSQARCEVSGVPFSGLIVPGCRKRPFIPSFDRIRAKEGYTPDNVRLVCWAVNLAISEWGDDIFHTIVKSTMQRLAD